MALNPHLNRSGHNPLCLTFLTRLPILLFHPMTQFLICPHMANLKVWFIKGKDKISTTSLWFFPISFSMYATELSTWYSSHISSSFILYHKFPNSFGFLSTTRFLFLTLTSRQWSLSVGKLLWLKNRRLSKTITHGIFSFCPSNARPIGHKWVYKIKIKSNGSLDKYKAILVALGYRQDTELAIMKYLLLWTILALVAKSWPILHLACILTWRSQGNSITSLLSAIKFQVTHVCRFQWFYMYSSRFHVHGLRYFGLQFSKMGLNKGIVITHQILLAFKASLYFWSMLVTFLFLGIISLALLPWNKYSHVFTWKIKAPYFLSLEVTPTTSSLFLS